VCPHLQCSCNLGLDSLATALSLSLSLSLYHPLPFIPLSAVTRDTSNEALNSIKEDKGIKYEFQLFAKASTLNSGPPPAKVANNAKHEEYQYLDLISDILENGAPRPPHFLPSSPPPFLLSPFPLFPSLLSGKLGRI
jgi:hypothetical protein